MPFSKQDLKMHLLKQAINYVAPRILRLSKGVNAETPQSKLILRVWDRIEAVVKKEVETGCWDDKNFRNLLDATKEALIFLCEKDKYYKRWLGLLMMFIAEEVSKAKEEFSYQEALNMTVRPMMITEKEFARHREALFELHLTGYLYGMSRLGNGSILEIKQAREENTDIEFPCADPNAYVKMWFQKDNPPFFTMFFRERTVYGNEEKKEE